MSKQMVESYVRDRSAITRRNLVDYSVLLPHYSPHLPNFTTTFTELCPPLCEVFRHCSQFAEKRRRRAEEEELKGQGFSDWPPPEDLIELGADQADGILDRGSEEAGGAMSSGLSALLGPLLAPGRAGLEAAGPVSSAGDVRREAAVEAQLLAGAPTSLGAVITGSMDEEDQTGNAAARIGYSGRTEKMHRFLAREFSEGGQGALSYESICRRPSAAEDVGSRELISSCFFELLVLRTNGVIGLNQEEAQADIRISKAKQWMK